MAAGAALTPIALFGHREMERLRQKGELFLKGTDGGCMGDERVATGRGERHRFRGKGGAVLIEFQGGGAEEEEFGNGDPFGGCSGVEARSRTGGDALA